MKKSKGKVSLLIVILCCIIVFSGGLCSMPSCIISCLGLGEYGYKYHYMVEGGNGDIYYARRQQQDKILCKESSCYLNCPENSYFLSFLGRKKGGLEIEFVAIPDEGYQVKEWRINGKIIEGNKTNACAAYLSYKDKYNCIVVVVFEPIQE